MAIAIPSTQAHEGNTWPALSYFVAAVRKRVATAIPSRDPCGSRRRTRGCEY